MMQSNKMTISDVYGELCRLFKNNSIDDGEIEARLIVEKVFCLGCGEYFLKKDFSVTDEQKKASFAMGKRRVEGTPIQYVLGEWDFMGLTFKVGNGVLIPRPETEILCEYALDLLKEKESPVVYDLCSGSGCIGISLKYFKKDANVFLMEKSQLALKYIKLNAESLVGGDVSVIFCDILENEKVFESLPPADLIISNPPYIKSEEIDSLQSEVLEEPHMALDGGKDGLIFYRRLASFWTSKLKFDGIIAMECGEDQSAQIKEIFSQKDFSVKTIRDYNEIERIVIGKKVGL